MLKHLMKRVNLRMKLLLKTVLKIKRLINEDEAAQNEYSNALQKLKTLSTAFQVAL